MQEVMGLIRHALTTVGGMFVANGMITNTDQDAIIGGLMAAIGVAWSLYDKRRAK